MSSSETFRVIRDSLGRRPTKIDVNKVIQLLCDDYEIRTSDDAKMVMRFLEKLFLDHHRSPDA